jgi:hypothetical protein
MLTTHKYNGDIKALSKKDFDEVEKYIWTNKADADEIYSLVLPYAAINGNFELVKDLVEHDAEINDEIDFLNESLDPEIYFYLINNGASPLSSYVYSHPNTPYPRWPMTYRPINKMGFVHEKCSDKSKNTFNDTEKYYLPVVRYEGIYYSNVRTNNEYCGTFYYYEPNSNVFIDLGNVLITGNKYDALRELSDEDWSEDISVSLARLKSGKPYTEEETIAYRRYKLSDFTEIDKFFTKILTDEEDVDSYKLKFNGVNLNPLFIDSTGEYYGNIFYAILDDLDQIICDLARHKGYDTIILQREPGNYRAVTEILDTRQRPNSFLSLCRHNNGPFSSLNSKYPTIWYPSYGYLTF